MDIKLNNQTKTLPDKCSLQHLVHDVMPQKQMGIAIAVNHAVIAREDWSSHLLHPNDEVLIIKAIQGG